MIVPCGYRIMVKVPELTEVDPVLRRAKSLGFEIPVDHEDFRRQQNAVDQGEILAMGPQAFKELGGPEANGVQVGDIAIYAKYAGKIVTDTDGQKFMIINDEDVVAILKKG